jgi:Tol biopolymer transport system component
VPRVVLIAAGLLVAAVSSAAADSSPNIAAISHPAWSPTRAEIAFDARFDDGSSAVLITTPDGKHVRRLTILGRRPVWSPNGNRIAVIGANDRNEFVEVVRRDGTNAGGGWATTVIEPEVVPHAVAWAPDSEQLAFNHLDPTISPDGIVVTAVGDPFTDYFDYDGYAPAWSPRGDVIAYSIVHCTCRKRACGDRIESNGNCGRWPYPVWPVLYLKSPVGTRRRRLLRGENAAWSSDGRLLAFTTTEGVSVARRDGTGRRLVFRASLRSAGEVMQPMWAPHRPLIAVRRASGVFVIDVARGVVRRVARGYTSRPSWSSDGRRLVFAAGVRLYIVGANGRDGHFVTPVSP